jgi:enoyl-[acyl-carrier protein] reductase III
MVPAHLAVSAGAITILVIQSRRTHSREECQSAALGRPTESGTTMAVLITGGTKGIGLAIARRFAKPGVDILMAYRRDDASADSASAEIAALGARPHAIKSDVSTPAGARALLAKVGAVVDRLDLVVHGAVKVLVGPILDADPDAFAEAITLNGTSLVFLVQAARPLLKRGSSVIFLSSRGSRQIVPAYGAIGAGKALAEALARYLAPELAPLGVRINCIAPGTLDTEAVRDLFGGETDAFLASEAAGNPSGRNITHDDYIGLVTFLASPEASMIQGQVIFVNGGQYIVA